MESAAFLGHRLERFRFKYQEENLLCQNIKRTLWEQAAVLYSQGVRRFLCGPAPGVGFWSADAVLKLIAGTEHPGVSFVCVLPFEGCDHSWSKNNRRRFHRLLGACDEVIAVSAFIPNAGDKKAIGTAYKRRDYHLVDQAEHLVAVYDQDWSVRTQVGQSVNYAKSKGRRIVFIHPDTAEVTF